MKQTNRIELPVKGMDCAECVVHVREAIAQVPGIISVEVFLAAQKAVLQADPEQIDLGAVRRAVAAAGYSIPEDAQPESGMPAQTRAAGLARIGVDFTRTVLSLFGMLFGAVLLIVVVGEWLGVFQRLTTLVPWWAGLAVVLLGGYPVFLNVIRAARKKKVISHTLMSVGVLAAILVGQWVTAAVVVFFMRVGDFTEHFTTEHARKAVKDLTRMAPQRARVERDGQELEIPLGEVNLGEIVVVRPGEMIPVDGEIIAGHATLNQASITGESMPVDVAAGAKVFAATIAQLGSLRVCTLAVGRDTTFGRIIQLVEEAEAKRADVQRVADRFSGWFLPLVGAIAVLTLLLRRDPLATAAVLVVACSCSFALATPIAMLASIGAAARHGILIKGGKYLEQLKEIDVLLVDKTGTLTMGCPEITDVIPLAEQSEAEVLRIAASAERYSEHPLARAVCDYARSRGIQLAGVDHFTAVPGQGVAAVVDGQTVMVGSGRMVYSTSAQTLETRLQNEGKTLLYVVCNAQVIGLIAAADTLRGEVKPALARLRALGITRIELLTGDNQTAAAELARSLGISFRAELLPQDKIAIVKEYQAQNHRVAMVGDGVNDAPALAQADVGIAIAPLQSGGAGSDVAVAAAHIVLMREDWMLVPQVFEIARRTLRVVRINLAFTIVYNLIGLSLAAFGFLPPILAAAAQSLPDIGILANSSRLIKQ
jgi:P-type Cu+ transporter